MDCDFTHANIKEFHISHQKLNYERRNIADDNWSVSMWWLTYMFCIKITTTILLYLINSSKKFGFFLKICFILWIKVILLTSPSVFLSNDMSFIEIGFLIAQIRHCECGKVTYHIWYLCWIPIIMLGFTPLTLYTEWKPRMMMGN